MSLLGSQRARQSGCKWRRTRGRCSPAELSREGIAPDVRAPEEGPSGLRAVDALQAGAARRLAAGAVADTGAAVGGGGAVLALSRVDAGADAGAGIEAAAAVAGRVPLSKPRLTQVSPPRLASSQSSEHWTCPSPQAPATQLEVSRVQRGGGSQAAAVEALRGTTSAAQVAAVALLASLLNAVTALRSAAAAGRAHPGGGLAAGTVADAGAAVGGRGGGLAIAVGAAGGALVQRLVAGAAQTGIGARMTAVVGAGRASERGMSKMSR